MIAYVQGHKLRLYIAAVTSITLIVLLLQVYAGVHT